MYNVTLSLLDTYCCWPSRETCAFHGGCVLLR